MRFASSVQWRGTVGNISERSYYCIWGKQEKIFSVNYINKCKQQKINIVHTWTRTFVTLLPLPALPLARLPAISWSRTGTRACSLHCSASTCTCARAPPTPVAPSTFDWRKEKVIFNQTDTCLLEAFRQHIFSN